MNAQIIMDGLIAGSMIGLGAIGITLTYSILRFANFAHGDMISWAAYFALTVSAALGTMMPGLSAPIGPFSFGWSLPAGLIASIVLTGLLALLIDALLFGKLRKRGGAAIILVMAGFGAALTLRSFLEFVFTSKPAYFTDALQIAHPLLGGARATADQLLGLGLAVVLAALVHMALTRTAAGRAMRAVSENQALAGLAGVNVAKTIRLAWVFGAGLAAVAGVMAGLLVQIRPYMGHDLLLPLFAAAILGGIGSVPGAMIAGLIIGLAEALCVQFVGAEWRAAVSFVVLVAILLLRPQGIFGKQAT
jgi:branched-chain amino acid transport system permease protein